MPSELSLFWKIASPLLLLFFFALLAHSLYGIAQRHAPADSTEPTGVKGWLFVVLTLLMLLGLYRLAATANVFSWLLTQSGGDPSFVDLIRYAGPSALTSLFAFGALNRLTVGRRPYDVAAAVVLFWCAGPIGEWVSAALLEVPYVLQDLVVQMLLSACATFYLGLSRRSRRTYGLFSEKQ